MATLNVSEKPAAATSSAPSILPLPITPYASMNTNWSDVGPAGLTQCVAAAPDSLANSQDTIWVGAATGGVMTYSIVNAAWTNVASDSVGALTALSATEAYAAPDDGSPVVHYVNGQREILPAVPNGDYVGLLASAPDGTLWAVGPNGCYLWNGSGWTTTNTNGYALNALATTGANGAWAVGNLGTLLVYSPTQGWQPVPAFSGQIVSSVGAAPDGSVWIAGTGSQPFQVLQSDGSWQTVPMQSPGDLALSRMSAASRYRCYVAWFSGLLTVQISCLSLGIVDQPATPWPAMTASQSALYTAISQFLLTQPIGEPPSAGTWDIRSHYNDTLANLQTWYTNLKTETWAEFIASYPGPYTEQDWNIVQPQLLTELSYAEEVNSLFGQINGLLTSIDGLNATALQSIPGLVGLSQPSGPDGSDTVVAVIGGILQALMWGLAGIGGMGEGIGFALGAAASALGSGLDAMNGRASPGNRSQQISTTYYDITENILLNLYKSAANVSGTSQTAIVQDWARLNLVGNACYTGLWNWPDQQTSQIVSYVVSAYNVWFFQVLMTAKWEVVYVMWSNESGSWNSRTADYLTYTEPNIGMGGTDTYFCVEIGGDTDYWNPPEMGPFPAEILMDAIWSLGVQKADFFKNQNGWNNPVVGA